MFIFHCIYLDFEKKILTTYTNFEETCFRLYRLKTSVFHIWPSAQTYLCNAVLSNVFENFAETNATDIFNNKYLQNICTYAFIEIEKLKEIVRIRKDWWQTMEKIYTCSQYTVDFCLLKEPQLLDEKHDPFGACLARLQTQITLKHFIYPCVKLHLISYVSILLFKVHV